MFNSLLQNLRRKLFGPKTPPAATHPSIESLVLYLTEQISVPERAPSILSSIMRFRNLSAPDQEQELPVLYLLLEKYLVEIDPHKKFNREQLRSIIRSKHGDLLELSQFALIFQTPSRQERLLCRLFLQTALRRAYLVLGNSSHHLPFDLSDDLHNDKKQWIGNVRQSAHQIFQYLASTLGDKTASTIFEHSYQQVLDIYIGLETFPVVIRLLPDQLLDERKIDLLSRNQMQYVLLDKVDQMQQINEELSRKNEALQQAQKELQDSQQALERRVVERTQELRQANEQVQNSLDEKDILLQEIHHRVKNNLQVISSLLGLQATTMSDKIVTEALEESRNRVLTMALIHETLYQSDDMAHVDFGTYVHNLVGQLSHSYQVTAQPAEVRIDIESISLDIDQAIACGLIINELVTNAFKYAFPDESGTIDISVHLNDGDEFALRVADDGVGFPTDLDINTSDTLGLKVVSALTRQIGGRLQLLREGGTCVEITFARPAKHST